MSSEQTAIATFDKKSLGADLPEIKIKLKDIEKGFMLIEFLYSNNIVPSKNEARRIILNRGLKINNILVEDVKKILNKNDFINENLKVSCGKKKHYLVKIT